MVTGITFLNFMTNRQDGPSQSRRTVVVYVTPHLVKLLEYGYWDYFSELHDEPAGWTVTVTTDRRGLRNPTLSQTSPSSFSNCTMLQFFENIMSCCYVLIFVDTSKLCYEPFFQWSSLVCLNYLCVIFTLKFTTEDCTN